MGIAAGTLGHCRSLFGPRDCSYKLWDQPQFYEQGPNIRFSIDQDGVWVELSYNGRKYWPTVLYEMAHETVHLLDPVVGSATYLEEGVAVAFSIQVQHLYGVKVQVPSMPSYAHALKLVGKLPGNALSAAARIRREVGRFSNVSAEDLLALYPHLDAKLAMELTRKFDRDAVPSNSVNGQLVSRTLSTSMHFYQGEPPARPYKTC